VAWFDLSGYADYFFASRPTEPSMARIVSLVLLTLGVGCVIGCGKADPPTRPADPPEPTVTPPNPPPTEPTPPTTAQTPPKPTTTTLRGAIVHPGTKGQKLHVSYVELTGDDWVGDGIGHPLPEAAASERVEASAHPPRGAVLAVEKGATTFEFTGLPAGTYFVSARLEGGSAAWARVEVKGEAVTQDLKLEAGKGGTVEVKTPADFVGDLRLAPNALIPADDAKFVGVRIATQLELKGAAKDGKAVIPDVPPGKYTLYAVPGAATPRGTVEVTAGKTATAEVQGEKK
jgi:hypothetical protein